MNPKVKKAQLQQQLIYYFDPDIMGIFQPFQSAMMWRLDLLNYDDVVQNFEIIMYQINGGGMPPPPRQPLSSEAIAKLNNWKNNGFLLKSPT